MIDNLISNFGIYPDSIAELDGDINYSNKKYIVTDNSGTRYILKIYIDDEELSLAQEEVKILNQISDSLSFEVPLSIPNKKGKYFTSSNNGEYCLLRYIEGSFISDIDQSDNLLLDFGRSIGKLHLALKDIDSPILKARKLFWDIQYAQLSYNKIEHISDPSLRKYVDYYFQRFHNKVLPQLHTLRHSYIHGDLNDYNVLSEDNRIKGIIDFGDACYTPLINELAIAATYIMMGKANPFDSIKPLIKGFNDIIPLSREEILILPDLISTRLCISLCNSAEKKARSEDNEYILISEEPAKNLLKRWNKVSRLAITNKMLTAIDMSPLKQGIDQDEAKKRRESVSSKSLSLSYSTPIYMQSALFQYMYDKNGDTYLDAYNNIPHVGHSHPGISRSVAEQISKLNTNTRYLYDSFNEYADQLLSYFPDRLNKVFFVNSGSAASDLAIRLAKNYRERNHILVVDHAYHGNTSTGISISPYKFDGKGGKGLPEGISKLPLPNTYRSSLSGEDYAAEAISIIKQLEASNTQAAAFISEPVSGCGGQVPLAPGYLKALYPYLRKSGILTISDEVQVGFGRLGKWFWGFEMHGVCPDIVVLGKPMGNGHPIGAVVTSAEIADSFASGMEFFSSFGGNPVSCEAAKAVLDIISSEGLQQNADHTGAYYLNCLQELKTEHAEIGDIRGSGLFIGMEFTDEDGKPGTELANRLKNQLKDHFILTGTDGPFDNVLKSKPPLCFNRKNVDQVVHTIDKILKGF